MDPAILFWAICTVDERGRCESFAGSIPIPSYGVEFIVGRSESYAGRTNGRCTGPRASSGGSDDAVSTTTRTSATSSTEELFIGYGKPSDWAATKIGTYPT